MQIKDSFKGEATKKLCAYAREKYGDELEFLWKDSKNAILRKKKNRKWYALFCIVDRAKLKADKLEANNVEKSGIVEILTIKLDTQDVLAFVDNKRFFKAYHMNKRHWISIILDDEDSNFTQLCNLLDESYNLA